MAIREGRWDCPTCGTDGLLGRQVGCPNCGDPRPEGIRFYLPEDAPEVTDAGQLAQAHAGADWICAHCGSSARATQDRCPGCGADRADCELQDEHEYALDEIPRSGDEPRPVMAAAAPVPRRRWKGPAFVLAVIAAVGWCNSPKEVTATVASASWERAIEVQEERTVREEDWAVPPGGRQERSFRAIRDYRQVLDHHETRTRQVSDRVQVGTRTYTCGSRDRGNGYFEDVTCTEPQYETRYRTETYQEPIYRREPIYDTKYAYQIERWIPDDTLWDRGEGTREPSWPTVKLERKQREGARIEKYVLRFTDEDGETHERQVPLDQFTRYRPGSEVTLKMRRGGGGEVEIIDPEPAN